MSARNGTNVASAVTTFTDLDKYATAYADEINGGMHSVNTIADRNAIPLPRRKVGMHCQIFDSVNKIKGKEYILINEPGTESTTNSDWAESIPDASSINMLDDPTTTIEDRILANENSSALKFYEFVIKDSDIAVGPVNIELSPQTKSQITAIQMLIPIGTVSTADITAQIERYNGTAWSIVDTVTIATSNTAKSILKTLTTPLAVATTDRIRVNFLAIDLAVKTANVVVTMKTIK